jgi:chemotaxis protein MotB
VAEKAVQPIIKKIKKVTGHGAHGGVWKLAYADFVTAMMAFFLLMWLLNVTSEEMKSGLAQYFSPEAVSTSSNGSGDVFFGLTISVDQPMEAQSIGTAVIIPLPEANRSGQGGGAAGETGTQKGTAEAGAAGNESGGAGVAAVVVGQATAGKTTTNGSSGAGAGTGGGSGGQSGTSAGGENTAQGTSQAQAQAQAQGGQMQVESLPQGPGSDVANQARRDSNDAIAQNLRETLNAALKDAPAGGITAENVKVTTEAEGVMIEIGDTPNAAMFEIGKSVLQPTSTQFLRKLADVLKSRPEPIMIYGHTDGRQYPDTAAFTNWELSADRANEARRSLITAGIRSDRIVRVVANADRFLKDTQNPLAAQNRRIQILLRT